jgi:hypothetical protein
MLIVGSLDLSTVDGAVPFPLVGQRLMMWLPGCHGPWYWLVWAEAADWNCAG